MATGMNMEYLNIQVITILLLWYIVAASPRCKKKGTKKINYVLVSSCGSGFLVDYNCGCPRRLTKYKHLNIYFFSIL